MAQLSQAFCSQCGSAFISGQHFCPTCGVTSPTPVYDPEQREFGADTDITQRVACIGQQTSSADILTTHTINRPLQNQMAPGDTDATIRISSRLPEGAKRHVRRSDEDTDATVRATRLRSHIFAQAAQHEATTLSTSFKSSEYKQASAEGLVPVGANVRASKTPLAGIPTMDETLVEDVAHSREITCPPDKVPAGQYRLTKKNDSECETDGRPQGSPLLYTAGDPSISCIVGATLVVARRMGGLSGSVLSLVLLLGLLLFGVIGSSIDPRVQQQVGQSKAQLDAVVAHARALGVSSSFLQPILTQEQQLSSSKAPFTLFTQEPITSYYQHLAQSYHHLLTQMTGIITNATQQSQIQAQQDMQSFQSAFSRANLQSLGNIQSFAQEFSADQLLLASAQYPRDYAAISKDARQTMLALNALEVTLSQLADFNTTIVRMKGAHLDTSAVQAEYQDDLQMFDNATLLVEFQNLDAQIEAQYQQVIVNSIQAFPYISITKLNQLETQVNQLKTYGLDASYYQARLSDDQVAQSKARTVYDDLLFIRQIDTDIASMRDQLAQGQAHYLVKQFHTEVDAWAKAHAFYDGSDGRNYALDNGYMNAGIGAALDSDLASATSTADFETMIDEAQNALFNLHMLEADYSDHTPYNQMHASDLQIINHYKLQHKQLLMVSLVEQTMRIYQQGKLVQSYYVTTGRQELPSLPGVWSVLDRKSPIIFKAADPPGSPYWFPDTPISYAILYHYGGYFVHDAPWRADFGPGTQFPHQDASGTTAYNFDGSHGCINLRENDAAWVYNHTDWNTVIVIY